MCVVFALFPISVFSAIMPKAVKQTTHQAIFISKCKLIHCFVILSQEFRLFFSLLLCVVVVVWESREKWKLKKSNWGRLKCISRIDLSAFLGLNIHLIYWQYIFGWNAFREQSLSFHFASNMNHLCAFNLFLPLLFYFRRLITVLRCIDKCLRDHWLELVVVRDRGIKKSRQRPLIATKWKKMAFCAS